MALGSHGGVTVYMQRTSIFDCPPLTELIHWLGQKVQADATRISMGYSTVASEMDVFSTVAPRKIY